MVLNVRDPKQPLSVLQQEDTGKAKDGDVYFLITTRKNITALALKEFLIRTQSPCVQQQLTTTLLNHFLISGDTALRRRSATKMSASL